MHKFHYKKCLGGWRGRGFTVSIFGLPTPCIFSEEEKFKLGKDVPIWTAAHYEVTIYHNVMEFIHVGYRCPIHANYLTELQVYRGHWALPTMPSTKFKAKNTPKYITNHPWGEFIFLGKKTPGISTHMLTKFSNCKWQQRSNVRKQLYCNFWHVSRIFWTHFVFETADILDLAILLTQTHLLSHIQLKTLSFKILVQSLVSFHWRY